jgi:hypothetical protein
MGEDAPVTPEVARVLARWAGIRDSMPSRQLAEIFENVRTVVNRLYAVDVENFEADFVQPDSRAR